jgi:hypothetical protein
MLQRYVVKARTELAQDRVKWQDLVNTVMKLRDPAEPLLGFSSLLRLKRLKGMKLVTHLHLVSRLRMNEPLPHSPGRRQ